MTVRFPSTITESPDGAVGRGEGAGVRLGDELEGGETLRDGGIVGDGSIG